MDDLKVMEPDEKALRTIFTELEFRTLADKFLNKPQKAPAKVDSQPDLFGFFAPTSTESHENPQFFSLKDVNHNYKLVENEKDAEELYDFLRTNEILVLDT